MAIQYRKKKYLFKPGSGNNPVKCQRSDNNIQRIIVSNSMI